MSAWKDIKTAPMNGTWIRVRGRDFGNSQNKRHYAIAFYEDGNWHEVGSQGGLLYYLDGWTHLSESDSRFHRNE